MNRQITPNPEFTRDTIDLPGIGTFRGPDCPVIREAVRMSNEAGIELMTLKNDEGCWYVLIPSPLYGPREIH